MSSEISLDEVAQLIRGRSPSAGPTIVVGIDGCGGAGKSTLAARLADLLMAKVVPTDDFASWDNPIEWWPRLLEQVLVPLAENRLARYQRYDWTQRRLAEWISIVAPIVIVEGVTATRDEFLPYLAFSIWIDCPHDERLRRGLERDGAEAAPLWREWMEAEYRYCDAQRPRDRADVIAETFPTVRFLANVNSPE
jgi:uridine kinase